MLKEVLQVAMDNPEVTISALIAFGMAFSPPIRKLIGKRDKWHCQDEDCDKAFQKGDMVHASHWLHDKSDPAYDTVEAGRIQCIDHHQEYHEGAVGEEDSIGICRQANNAAINFLKQTPRVVQRKKE